MRVYGGLGTTKAPGRLTLVGGKRREQSGPAPPNPLVKIQRRFALTSNLLEGRETSFLRKSPWPHRRYDHIIRLLRRGDGSIRARVLLDSAIGQTMATGPSSAPPGLG